MTNDENRRPVFVRYWGSHFKFREQVGLFASEMRPLVARGWPCVLVMDRAPENPEWLRELEQLGVRFEYLPRPRSMLDWACIRRVRQLCRRHRVSVLRCDNFHTVAMLGAFLARVPVRVWVKGSMSSCYENCRPPTWRDRLCPSVRLSCAFATRVIATSAAVRDELVGLGISAARVVVRHLPRRLGSSQPGLDRDRGREQFGLGGDKLVFVTIGHAVPVKGWDILLRAFKTVAEKIPSAHLLFVGSHDAGAEKICHAELMEFIRQHNLIGRVMFAGHLDDVRPALRAADVFVLPSRSEGFCYALLEAMESRVPVVSTRVGVATDLIRDGENGLLVARNEVEPLAKAMLCLARDSALRNRFVESSVVPPSIPTLEEYAERMAKDFEALMAGTDLMQEAQKQ